MSNASTGQDGDVTTALRFPIHPGQSDTLVHFTGRARPSASRDVAHLTPEARLDAILRTGALRAFGTYQSAWPVVCFSESDSGGVEALLRHGQFQPWGVVVRRDWVWRRGGGPVWYARDDVVGAASELDERTRSWIVPTTPQHNDWLHEREWRLPMRDAAITDVGLSDGVVAILVADPMWKPGPVAAIDINPATGALAIAEQTPPLAVVPRWYWNGVAIEVLAPVQIGVHGYHDL